MTLEELFLDEERRNSAEEEDFEAILEKEKEEVQKILQVLQPYRLKEE